MQTDDFIVDNFFMALDFAEKAEIKEDEKED